MSDRLRVAVLYGVLSILLFGVALGLTMGESIGAPLLWGALASVQVAFAFFAMGYTSGRSDQREGRVK